MIASTRDALIDRLEGLARAVTERSRVKNHAGAHRSDLAAWRIIDGCSDADDRANMLDIYRAALAPRASASERG